MTNFMHIFLPEFSLRDQMFAGTSWGNPQWLQTCGTKMKNSILFHQQVEAVKTSAGLNHPLCSVRNSRCKGISLWNKNKTTSRSQPFNKNKFATYVLSLHMWHVRSDAPLSHCVTLSHKKFKERILETKIWEMLKVKRNRHFVRL